MTRVLASSIDHLLTYVAYIIKLRSVFCASLLVRFIGWQSKDYPDLVPRACDPYGLRPGSKALGNCNGIDPKFRSLVPRLPMLSYTRDLFLVTFHERY